MNARDVVPETTRALLPSAGLNFARATPHVFSHTVAVVDHRGEPATAIMFRCTETGAVRRWGCE